MPDLRERAGLFSRAREMECQICHKIFPTYASCKNGHYVCDQCHAQKGVQVILEGCKNSSSKNPIALMQELMENPFIYMHDRSIISWLEPRS